MPFDEMMQVFVNGQNGHQLLYQAIHWVYIYKSLLKGIFNSKCQKKLQVQDQPEPSPDQDGSHVIKITPLTIGKWCGICFWTRILEIPVLTDFASNPPL